MHDHLIFDEGKPLPAGSHHAVITCAQWQMLPADLVDGLMREAKNLIDAQKELAALKDDLTTANQKSMDSYTGAVTEFRARWARRI